MSIGIDSWLAWLKTAATAGRRTGANRKRSGWPRTGARSGAEASPVTVLFAEHPSGLFADRTRTRCLLSIRAGHQAIAGPKLMHYCPLVGPAFGAGAIDVAADEVVDVVVLNGYPGGPFT